MVMSNRPAPDPSREFCGTLALGDALIHHCQTIHFSAPNKSGFARCGLLIVYGGTHTQDGSTLQEAYRKANAPAG